MNNDSQSKDMTAHRDECCVSVVRSLVGAMRAYQSAVALQGLTLAQFHILDRLAEANGGLYQKQLVAAAETAKASGLSALLRRLEYEYNWIFREDDPKNRRTSVVKLTPKGFKVWKKASPIYREIIQKKLEPIDTRVLDRLANDLQALERLLK